MQIAFRRPPDAPYRGARLPSPPAFPDTGRLLRATGIAAALALLACASLFLPAAAGRSVAREALDALALEGSGLPAVLVASVFAIAAWTFVACCRSVRGGCPPLRVERRALAIGTMLFVALHVALGHAVLRDATAIRTTVLVPILILPLGLAAACAAYRCEGWEGWAYALLSVALALAGSAYSTAVLSAARGERAGVAVEIGGYAHLAAIAALVLVAGWAIAPIATAHDVYTTVGMGALAAALDAVAMSGLALLQGVRSTADLLGPYDHRGWWESYFLAQRLLGGGALVLALTSTLLARHRRYGLASLLLVGLVCKVAAH